MKNQKTIKRLTIFCIAAALVMACSGTALGFGHYTPGALAINAASLPPQGFHYTMYNIFYSADTLTDDSGNDMNMGLDLDVYAMANQFTYITKHKILGADFGFDVIIPLVNTDIEMTAAGIDESSFGIGDLYVEPFVLAWHRPRWDVAFALGFFAPTAESDTPSSPGTGYWSFMETLGATCYLDDAKSWSVSVLTRWLQNTEDDDTNITPGADMVAEYGLAKAFPMNDRLIFTAGLAGYTYAQLTDDSGAGAGDERFFGSALGPEFRLMVFKPFPIQASLRYLKEYNVENSTKGQNVCLTLIGSF